MVVWIGMRHCSMGFENTLALVHQTWHAQISTDLLDSDSEVQTMESLSLWAS